MKNVQPIRALASLKLTVALLVVLLAVLTVGTLIESKSGTEAARAVYGAGWFRLILALFGVNLAASLVERWPWSRSHVGFGLTHGSMLVILLGSLLTDRYRLEGYLALWEGQTGNAFVVADDANRVTGGAEGNQRALPFTVRLDAFEIDTYPGTGRPAMFRSRVTVDDPARGAFGAVIEMNRPLSHGGLDFFQSSYRQEGGREMSILTVSRDPGLPVVFFGYALLMAGMATVIGTRIAQRRRHRRRVESRAQSRGSAAGRNAGTERAVALLLPLALWAAAGRAQEPEPSALSSLPEPAVVDELRYLPVQHDGRAMPLDTQAREAVRKITGEDAWGGADPVALVLGWTFDPGTWADVPVVKVDPELAAAAGFEVADGRGAFRQLATDPELRQQIADGRRRAQEEEPPMPLDEAAAELEERLLWIGRLLRGEAIRALPAADPVAAWAPTTASADGLLQVLRNQPATAPAHYPTGAAIVREVKYNRVRPTRLAWWILVPSTLLAVAAWLAGDGRAYRKVLDLLATGGLVAGFAVMTWGIASRWQIAGRIPASNMYESMLFLGWGVGLFALIAAAVLRNRMVILNATAMAALAMMLADLLPLDPFIHPMPPVLSGTAWLAIHVPIIMVSYAVLALGVMVAHMQVGLSIFAPARHQLAERMNDLLYWYILIGSYLLAAGILTGSIWAASSWGRYWGWDPKEVWSLIAFLAYMAILHGRFDRWLGPFAVAATSIVAFWTILMTYIGVNFVLSAGLHSYGFGGGAVVRWMALVAAVEVVFLGLGTAAWWRNRRQGQVMMAA